MEAQLKEIQETKKSIVEKNDEFIEQKKILENLKHEVQEEKTKIAIKQEKLKDDGNGGSVNKEFGWIRYFTLLFFFGLTFFF